MNNALNISEMAHLLGIKREHLHYAISQGLVPGPSRIIPGQVKLLYTLDDFAVLKRIYMHDTMPPSAGGDALNVPAICDLLEININRYHRYRYSGRLRGVGKQIGRQWWHKKEELPLLLELMDEGRKEIISEGEHAYKRRIESGFYTQTQAAELLGMPLISFRSCIKRGMPKPARFCSPYYCYNTNDIEDLKKWLAENYTPIKKEVSTE